eukprot:CAMPEP_0201507962 /NCGR_PEP_ID=MMETSP0161_2-20130828/1456_1 /ASSEMBLY_ACC=CAM_ASM_000251 /TAXON_ID=180227 /ORGANISM="Neoparamoeba aestuarina, Strain SoJaBio B1-5/56/2" /LENGTH=107 /DNA_ID=CAMNT_0047902461 /DNA_START=40 /DNA_END=360 /DNA_ORIENTATION=-
MANIMSQAEIQEFERKQAKAEELGDTILLLKAQSIELDKKRQGNREALHHLRHLPAAKKEKKVVVLVGDLYISLPYQKALETVEEEMASLTKEIEEKRNEMKKLVNE